MKFTTIDELHHFQFVLSYVTNYQDCYPLQYAKSEYLINMLAVNQATDVIFT
jgi:hypothetical protein